MPSDRKQYINFSEKFDELASDMDDIRELLLEVLQYNQNIVNEISKLNRASSITRDISEVSIKGVKTKSKSIPKKHKVKKIKDVSKTLVSAHSNSSDNESGIEELIYT